MENKVSGIFKGVIDKNKTDLQNNINQIREVMPLMEEQSRLVAQMRKKAYDMHIDAGFTPEQALNLCKQ